MYRSGGGTFRIWSEERRTIYSAWGRIYCGIPGVRSKFGHRREIYSVPRRETVERRTLGLPSKKSLPRDAKFR